MENKGEIIIYQTSDHQTQIEVKFEEETVWLSQRQMSNLFEKDTDTIGLHLKTIFQEGELDEDSTTELFSVVQQEGNRKVNRNIKYYNLDAIISVGYRVNSKRGIQFRQWATQRLREHLLKGYTLNEKRLQQLSQNITELEQAVRLIQQSGENEQLQLSEAKGLLQIISNYTHSFILLNQFDSNKFEEEKLNENITYKIRYTDAIDAIAELKKQLIKKKEASALFGYLKW